MRGSIEAFAEKMNRRAKELGATNTHFANPNGLHDLDHYTTPRDLARIARAAMQQPLFRQIVGTRDYDWVVDDASHPLHNHNRLLDRFPGCTGVKTGYTYPAQQVSSAPPCAITGRSSRWSCIRTSRASGTTACCFSDYGFDHLAAPTRGNDEGRMIDRSRGQRDAIDALPLFVPTVFERATCAGTSVPEMICEKLRFPFLKHAILSIPR